MTRRYAQSHDGRSFVNLTRTELLRVCDEFLSERDAAKRDAMRAFDERNIALTLAARMREDVKHAVVLLGDIVGTYECEHGDDEPSAVAARQFIAKHGPI